ncbi:MAG: branched-chain amino acid ABC transporter permease [Desulfarculaceae bacterium]|jgi:branched-chain amino acid transport system permease protein
MSITAAKNLPHFMVLVIAGLLALVVPLSGHDYFIIGLLTSMCIFVVYVVSWDLLEGYTGMLNFAQLLFAGAAAYTAAMIELYTGLPRWFAILAGLLAGTCSSLLISLPSLRVRSTYFALVSMAILLVAQKITMTFIDTFGGEYGLAVPRAFSREALFYASLVIMAGTLILSRILVQSRIGMAMQAIREDEETARAVGISVARYKLTATVASAFFTSCGGLCFFYTMGHVGPETFAMMPSFDIVIMGVVGGQGTIYGAALGGALMSLMLEFMRPIAEYRNIIYAMCLVLAIITAPKGIWGSLLNWYAGRREVKESLKKKRQPKVAASPAQE